MNSEGELLLRQQQTKLQEEYDAHYFYHITRWQAQF